MTKFEAKDPDFEARVRASFDRQAAMRTLGASLGRVAPGQVEVELPYRADLTQQQDLVHGGIVAAILDNACSYAALSLSAPETAVLTVEYKVNFVAPAKGERLLARGEVVRPGGSITVCKGNVTAFDGGEEQVVATMLATMMLLPNRPGLAD
jgi:uncharacterized protein (TIGR00369 family)